jgi:hypothetical protein
MDERAIARSGDAAVVATSAASSASTVPDETWAEPT